MSVQGEDKEAIGPAASENQDRRRDGLIDFTQYSAAQLKDLQFSIDSRTYPENFNNLLAELARREAENDGQGESALRISGKFTSGDGLHGWLEAKRKRSPLHGSGEVEVRATEILLLGWQRTWLGVPLQTQLTIPIEDICNAVQDANTVRFECRREHRRRKVLEFQTESREQASRLLAFLPTVKTAGFEKRWSEIREFNLALNAVSSRGWVTPAIVIVNIAVFAAMAAASRRLGAFDFQHLLAWGGNFGPYTVNGQWWRLITALFIHLNLLHLLLNMWAFWNVGRLTERLYGRWAFLFLYGVSGLLASLTSVAWEPARTSVGASGAIFGIFGAFLAFLAHRKSELPATIVRVHLTSTTLFILVNLISGFSQVGVDNAAHVGGLVSGFVLGWTLARPLDAQLRQPFPLRRSLAAVALTAAALFAGLWQVRGTGAQLTVPEQYMHNHAWYVSGEAENLRLWQELFIRVSVGSMGSAEFGNRFEREILPFWETANKCLQSERTSVPAAQQVFAGLVLDFVAAREQWARGLIKAAASGNLNDTATLDELARETDRVSARIERFGIRAGRDHRQRALANNPLFGRIRALLAGTGACVEKPAGASTPAPITSTTDGPSRRHVIGCDAQRLFLTGNYAELDEMMTRFATTSADLPDGSSRFDGVTDGLSELFDYGKLDALQAFGRTSEWRGSVPGSIEPELVEAMLFRAWAWSARGHGAASGVNAQALALFSHRSEMAAAGLSEIATRAKANPLWYELSLNNGLDRSISLEKLRAIFDQGVEEFPRSLRLYRCMLRALMPRWGGSYDQVKQFIDEMSVKQSAGLRMETYARLYWIYASLEGDDINIFADAQANWEAMRVGLKEVQARYPKSDLVLNAYAKFACLGGDSREYAILRPQLKNRPAVDVWTDKTSIENCDKYFAVQKNADAGTVRASATSAESAMKQAAAADLYVDAQLAYDHHDWATMKSRAQQLIEVDPASPNGYAVAASAAEALHDYDAAIINYRSLVSLNPKWPQGWYRLGEADMATHDYAEAEIAFTQALELDPRMWDAWSERSVVREALGRRPAALQDAQTACRNGLSFACRLVEELKPATP